MTDRATPLNDDIEHELSDDCPCGPRQEPVKRDDGSVGWVVVHHSLDDRERHEEEPADDSGHYDERDEA